MASSKINSLMGPTSTSGTTEIVSVTFKAYCRTFVTRC